MGLTVTCDTQCTDVNIMKKALESCFGFTKFKIVTREEEAKGINLNKETHLVGGIKGNIPIVLKVAKGDMKDKQGRQAVWSDLGVGRKADGTLQVQSDLHNFDVRDKITFIDDDFKKALHCSCGKMVVDQIAQAVNMETVEDWHKEGDFLEKTMSIKPSEIPNIPHTTYLK